MSVLRQRTRPLLAWLALIVAAAVLLPPGLTAASHYVFAQAVQFAALAVVQQDASSVPRTWPPGILGVWLTGPNWPEAGPSAE